MNQRWVDVLQNFVKSYNNRMHSSLGKWTPKSVNSNNESRVRLDQYFIKDKKDRHNFQQLELRQLIPRPFTFKLGSTLRIPYSFLESIVKNGAMKFTWLQKDLDAMG